MGRTSIGLDIGTRAVRVVEIRGAGNQRAISRFGRVLLPPGAVDHGEVQDPRAVTQAIETLWKRLRLQTKAVHIGMANRRVVVRVVEMPQMSRDDLDAAIRLQAQDHIPIPLSEAVMDYEVLEDVTGAEGQVVHRVLVVAAERASVDPLIEAVQNAKLDPRTLELNAYALVRSLGNGSGKAEAIVDIGAGVTNVVVHREGSIQFTRILPNFGGDDFTNALAEGLGVSMEQAEGIKRREAGDLAERVRDTGHEEPLAVAPSFVESPAMAAQTAVGFGSSSVPPSPPSAVDLMEPVLQRLANEVRSSVEFYSSQPDAVPVARVVLTGGGSMLGGLDESIGGALDIPTEIGHPFARVPVGKMKVSDEQVHVAERYLGVAVGLALAGGT